MEYSSDNIKRTLVSYCIVYSDYRATFEQTLLPSPPPPITNVKLVKYRVIAVSLSFTNSSSFTWCYYFLSKLHFIFEILLIILCNNSTTLPLSPQAFPLKFIDKWPLEFPFHVSFVFITTFVSLDYSIILIDRSIEPSSFCLIAKN